MLFPVLYKKSENGFENFWRFYKYDFHIRHLRVCYFEQIIRKPATISKADWMHMRNESGRNIETSIPNPAESSIMPTNNDVFFMLAAPFRCLIHYIHTADF